MQCIRTGTYLVCHLSHPLHLSGVQRSSNLLGTNGSIEYHGNQYLDLLSCGVVVVLVANIYTIASCIQALVFSHRKPLQRAVAKLDLVKSEGYLQV